MILDRARRLVWKLRPATPPPPPVLSFDSWEALAASNESVVQICHPDWRGVRTATYSFDSPVVEVSDAQHWTDSILDKMRGASVGTLVVQGFPPGSEHLLRAARSRGIETRCLLHSSPTQHGAEASEAAVVDTVLELLREGIIGRVGFAKEGVAEAFGALGFPVSYVPNRVPRISTLSPMDLGTDRLNVGVFAESFWRKNVVTQLCAVALLPNARAHVMQRPAARYLDGLEMVEHGELAWPEFVRLQGSVDLNLYVTLSECQPLTPLESYAAGVPCLFSRTSVLFRDDRELWELTTVDEADNPRAIAVAAQRLLEDAEGAVERAKSWMEAFDRRAADRWRAFIAPQP